MGEHISVIGLGEFKSLLKRHINKKTLAYQRAVRKAVREGVRIVRKNSPKAFNELRESTHAEGNSIVTDAPHAAAVEKGSRPHYVPLDQLIKWVKLRNLQGKRPGRLRKSESGKIGTTTLRQALTVRGQIKRNTRSGMSEEEAIVSVAKAIQSAILKAGTVPHFFAKNSLPELGRQLLLELQIANNTSVGV